MIDDRRKQLEHADASIPPPPESAASADPLSASEVVALVASVAEEMRSANETDEKRLAKVESQTLLLSQAVIAMAEPNRRIAPAVESVQAGMSDDPATDSGLPTPSEPRWNECPSCRSLLTDPVHRSPDGHGYRYFVCSECKHQWTAT